MGEKLDLFERVLRGTKAKLWMYECLVGHFW
jgi:hypothetical protein